MCVKAAPLPFGSTIGAYSSRYAAFLLRRDQQSDEIGHVEQAVPDAAAIAGDIRSDEWIWMKL
jgi:hypothetical protein